MKLLSAAPASFFSAASDLQLANAGAEIRQIATASITAFIGTSFQQNNAVLLKRIHRIIRVKPRPCLKPVFCRCRLDVRIIPQKRPCSGHSGTAGSCQKLPRADAANEAPIVRLFEDRKSTSLNSSHLGISYAVFCL